MEAKWKAGGRQQVIPKDLIEKLTLEHGPRGDEELAERMWKKEQLDKSLQHSSGLEQRQGGRSCGWQGGTQHAGPWKPL